jgi:hypothetical protein
MSAFPLAATLTPTATAAPPPTLTGTRIADRTENALVEDVRPQLAEVSHVDLNVQRVALLDVQQLRQRLPDRHRAVRERFERPIGTSVTVSSIPGKFAALSSLIMTCLDLDSYPILFASPSRCP